MDDSWLAVLALSPWLLPALFALVVGDAFLVVLPSETVVVALAALAGATGSPPLAPIIAVAAAGAIVGDALCFAIGRRAGTDRWRWQRMRPVRVAIDRARHAVLSRPAALIFTARYVPFARIAVNLTAGASGLSVQRFLPLSAAAGTAWALYNTAVGAFFGALLAEVPVLAVVISVVVAITLGLAIDALVARAIRRREGRENAE
ncbi:DedA family protein [Microcella sp.]|uniref:DedA family protein n=1 Tax=Microcella sp. TaxID=1913979 RepID=UPI003F705A48